MVELSLVEFPADDPERARQFWEGLLGPATASRFRTSPSPTSGLRVRAR
ncbi:MAG TPA: hypothetical protein VM184_01975 [Gaiellaceae bacterium]|nr:hypothetical protein [Gaiellaceae bacterium]